MVNWNRPVVVAPDGKASIPLSTYKTQSGGTGADGWSKAWYSANGADASERIATLAWLFGGNLFASYWYDTLMWYAGTFGYTGVDTIQTDAAATLTLTVKALDESENVLGTIYTLTATKTDKQTATIVDLVITGLDFSLAYNLEGVDGGYSGHANALLVELAWSGETETTGDPPLVGGLSSSTTAYAWLANVAG